MTSIPNWAVDHVQRVLRVGEVTRFIGSRRLDAVPPSGILAMIYWVTYIVTNYVAIFVTAFFRNRAVIVITDQRVIIVSERSWKYPLWVIPYSQRLITETIAVADITSLSTVSARFLWILSANGIQLECESGTSRIINGLNAATLDEAKAYVRG
ncbi:MAG TPA: hypothetical protein VK147_12515 [Candidatus Didemnitutus sp.]|nr:hypothetical protein [Candidatus Didemnitutus sp.]